MAVNDTLEQVTASGYGYGEYVTYDGVSYSLPKDGEFTLVNSSDIGVYVRQVSRLSSSLRVDTNLSPIFLLSVPTLHTAFAGST